jgi:hypothetical protein
MISTRESGSRSGTTGGAAPQPRFCAGSPAEGQLFRGGRACLARSWGATVTGCASPPSRSCCLFPLHHEAHVIFCHPPPPPNEVEYECVAIHVLVTHPSSASLYLSPLQAERLSRLKAEWEAAVARAELCRERFEREASSVARAHGLVGAFTLNVATGELVREPVVTST